MRKVFSKILYSLEENQDVEFVVIAEDKGSAPRKKGSVMVVGKSGYLTGTIGGGNVENVAIKRAVELLADKKSDIREYDLGLEGKELGMACGGKVIVYSQFMDHNDGKWTDFAKEILRIMDNGKEAFLKVDADEMKLSVAYEEVEDGMIYIPFKGEERAFIFGAGHIAMALAPILKTCDFNVTVLDDRAEYVTRERYPSADRLVVCDFTRLSDYIDESENDYAVIVTNGHKHDFECEEQMLRRKTAYIGVIGSRKKIAMVNGKLKTAGLSDDDIARVHTPIGLPIKAVTPAEIAVSIAAEMILERANRNKASE